MAASINMSSHSYSSVINLSKLKQHVLLFLQIYQYYIGSSGVASGAMVRALALYSDDPGSNLGGGEFWFAEFIVKSYSV